MAEASLRMDDVGNRDHISGVRPLQSAINVGPAYATMLDQSDDHRHVAVGRVLAELTARDDEIARGRVDESFGERFRERFEVRDQYSVRSAGDDARVLVSLDTLFASIDELDVTM